jgi:acetyl esterase/lipase
MPKAGRGWKPWLATLVALAAPAAAQEQVKLWPNGAPGFEARAAIPEQAEDYWTRSVNNPSVEVHLPPPANRTGTAVLIVPGGGHRLLVTTTEGADVARWFAHRGVAAFVLRYRLFREEGSPYTLAHARQDTERAMRLIRSRAGAWGVTKLGVWGFSAGGELARMVTLSPPVAAPGKGDAVDRLSARPDFAILEFPGPLHAEERVARDAPPVLLTAAADDACCAAPTLEVLQAYTKAGASAELHFYAAGGHAFNMGEDTPLVSLQHWPDRVLDWMGDRGLLGRPAPVFVAK